MSTRCLGFVQESGFDSLEVPLKYEDIDVSVQLSDDLMQKTVLEIKEFLLKNHPDFISVTETPEDLQLFAVFSTDPEERKELCDHTLMEKYKDVITKCQMLVLERRG